MEQGKFQELEWTILSPLATKLTNLWPGLSLKTNWSNRIEEQYEEARRLIRGAMRRDGIPDDEIRIDRHKVGAALIWAILRALPFSYDGKTIGGRFSNEYLAFHSAIAVVVSFGKTEANKAGNQALAAKYAATFQFPIANHDATYVEHTMKLLYNSRQNIDFFMLANLLFVLEQYHLAVNQPTAAAAG